MFDGCRRVICRVILLALIACSLPALAWGKESNAASIALPSNAEEKQRLEDLEGVYWLKLRFSGEWRDWLKIEIMIWKGKIELEVIEKTTVYSQNFRLDKIQYRAGELIMHGREVFSDTTWRVVVPLELPKLRGDGKFYSFANEGKPDSYFTKKVKAVKE